MRWMIAALAMGALAACDGATTGTDTADGASSPSGYTMEVRASGAEQTYIVIAPDGTTVAGRAADGASALMDSERAQALAANPPPEGEDLPEVFSMRLPGFSMSVGGTEDAGGGENGQVNISIGAGDGERITVRADEGGPGEADDRAYVRITGADEDSVREFIEEADELSPEVKTEMRTALGL